MSLKEFLEDYNDESLMGDFAGVLEIWYTRNYSCANFRLFTNIIDCALESEEVRNHLGDLLDTAIDIEDEEEIERTMTRLGYM